MGEEFNRNEYNHTPMDETELYALAKKRLEVKRDFVTHVVVYIAVNIFLAFINFYTSPGYLWFVWPLFGWGIGVAAHGVSTYYELHDDGRAIRREIKKLRDRGL